MPLCVSNKLLDEVIAGAQPTPTEMKQIARELLGAREVLARYNAPMSVKRELIDLTKGYLKLYHKLDVSWDETFVNLLRRAGYEVAVGFFYHPRHWQPNGREGDLNEPESFFDPISERAKLSRS